MGYKTPISQKTSLRVNETVEARSIEEKLYETIYNKEPIDNSIGAKSYNERKEGVIASRDIRTDRFEVAAVAMSNKADMLKDGYQKKAKDRIDKEQKARADAQKMVDDQSTHGNPDGTTKQ